MSTQKEKVILFQDRLLESVEPKEKPKTLIEGKVKGGSELISNPRHLYKFQNPANFSYRGIDAKSQDESRKTNTIPPRSSKRTREDVPDGDEKDVLLIRMIQKATRKPKYSMNASSVAPDDEEASRGLKTAEDAIAFFSACGSNSNVKYLFLNRVQAGLEFRPYDLLVVQKGREEREHYIMSCTGVVHVKPGNPSEVISLADWMKESSLFNILRKIPFFKNYLLYKAFFGWYRKLRDCKYLSRRKLLARDLMFSKATFTAPIADLNKLAFDLSSSPLIAYEPQGKHDYFVEEFANQQSLHRQQVLSLFTTSQERIEGKLVKLIEVIQQKADVPDLNTKEALEQYLLTLSVVDDANNNRVQRKTKSMSEAKKEQYQKMRELKRSMVEFSKLDSFIRLIDSITSENLFRNVLATLQNFLNVLRSQNLEDVRKVGFQLLLLPTDTEMLFNPAESIIRRACMDLITSCCAVASSTTRLSEQKYMRAFFARTPRFWSIASALRADARLNHIQDSVNLLVSRDFAQADTKMITYSTTLEHIHFLQKDYTMILDEFRDQEKEEVLSSLSLSKAYHRLQIAHNALRILMSSFVGNTLWINAAKLKTEVEPRMQIIRDGIDATLRATTRDIVRKLHTYFKQKTVLLNERPHVLRFFAEYVDNYQKIVDETPMTDATVSQAEALCDLMDRQQVEFAEDEDRQLKERTLGNNTTLSHSLRSLFEEARLQCETFIEENMGTHVDTLHEEVGNVEEECTGLRQLLCGEEFSALTENTEPVMQYLHEINSKLEDIKASEEQLTRYAKLFDQPAMDWTFLTEVVLLYEIRRDTWTLLSDYQEKIEYWFDCPIRELNTLEMEEQINFMVRQAGNLSRSMLEREYADELTPYLIEEMQAIRKNMASIHDCGNKHMTPEHWNIVLKAVTGSSYGYHDGLTLHSLQDRGIFNFKEILAEQSGLATGEWKITNDIETIRKIWDSISFTTKPYKNREGVFILDELEETIQQLDDHQIELQTIMASRFVAPVREEVENWIQRLRLISDVIEEWITLQKNWMYLEFIFSSDDIKDQLPEESAQFNEVDRLFRTLTGRANSLKNVLQICTAEGLLEQLRESNSHIDHIQKKLEDYLETKRIAFPRFYFLSNDELLSILSDVRNPKAVQPHLSKCFDSIASLIFSDETYSEILGMMSGEGEKVAFENPVRPIGSVEQWLNEIEFMMKASLLMHMRKTVEMYPLKKREEWFFDHPAQCIQAVDMIMWTGEVERSIASNDLGNYYNTYQKQILRMVDLVKQSLSKLQRTLICTLIVLDVHNRDIIQTLNTNMVTSLTDFTWAQQLRYHWEKDPGIKGGMNVGIYHCSAHLWYGYEYLGNQPRLVITPLTDRAFLTCTSALAMNLGAAPQGPAGTGKTESVKDLGKALARQVVVFNCSDGINYKTMSRMFAGLAQAGAWACFDEFNRIELEVLSVIAQQMLEITTALSQGQERMDFDGHPITLSKNFGVFITMNPGYAGRTELPDNLKALFRPICMMIPDYALIAEIMFYSEGFSEARVLAQKMVQLYKLSSEQLSKQDHYDFGMRAVKSILVMAGTLKRQNPNEDENMLLIRAMRDSNVPKFLRDDTVLFMALVRDLFPQVRVEENQSEKLVEYIKKSMQANGHQIVDGMVTKAIQLYDTLVVRHGVMMVGQTYCGKTTTIRTVQSSLTNLKEDGYDPEGAFPLINKTHIHLLNPKSVTMGELYGQVNEITREWTDGILSDIARNITKEAQTKPDRQWVVFDGPVDAVWIENMNTVLDDNKLLCLFNGERIKLPATATFMFEVQDLRVASPATVSRCGMVYVEPFYLDGKRGWIPVATSLAKSKNKDCPSLSVDRTLELLHKLLPETLDFIRKNCKEWIPSVDAQLAVSCIELLTGLLNAIKTGGVLPHKAMTSAEELAAEESEAAAANALNIAPRTSNAGRRRTSCALKEVPAPPEYSCPPIKKATTEPNDAILFDMYFFMAFVWSVGGNLRDDSRDAFSKFAKAKFASMMPQKIDLQDGMSVYDYVVHKPSMEFITWNYLVPDFSFNPALPYFELIVPTAETAALSTLLSVLVTSSRNVLINGVTGTGKSLSALSFISDTLEGDDPSGKWEYFATVFSAQTKSRDIEDRLDSKLYKVRSNVLGPTPGKRAIFFIDDLNMPTLEKYGASPPIELLRQLISQGGFFDKHKVPASFKELHDVIFLAACGVPGGGRNEISARLTSKFHLICQPAVSDSSTRRIFGSILYGFLNAWKSEEIAQIYNQLIDATNECYQRIMREKLPTPTRSHYTFNLRDFSKVIQGIMQASPRGAPTKEDIFRVFVHEVTRIFHDRLVDNDDRAWWWKTLAAVSSDKLGLKWEESFETILFGDFMRRDRSSYEEVKSYEDAHTLMAEYQNNLNVETNKETQLVFFKDAISHVARICRILRQPRGHALLVGMGGTGRQSLCKLAAFICNLVVHDVTITRTFSMTEFRESMKSILMSSGCKDEPALFFMSDAQIVYEEMLEDVNNLLNTGEIPNLMQSEDVDQIVEAVRPFATAAGKQETRNVIFSHFVSLCRENVHIVLAMSPIGDQFRRRLRMFPSLVNCCTIDWFDQWPADALASVAIRILESIEMEPELKEKIVELCVSIHLDVQARSHEFFEELRRHNYTTPTSYLELLTCYRRLLEEQDKIVTDQISRYQGGLDTLRSTQKVIDQMKVLLIEMQPKLIQAAKDTEEIMVKVEEEQKAAEVVRKQCAQEEEVAGGIRAEADGIRAECQAELDKALPILRAAENALDELRPDDIREVKSFQKPASRVVLVMEAVLTLLGEKDLSWDRAKLVMGQMNFIKDLQNYKKDDLTEKMVKSIQKYINNPDFQPEEVAKSSKACKSLAIWVLAINNYYEVVKVVAPKRVRLAEAEGKLAVATKALEEAQGKLKEIQDKLDALRKSMKENMDKRQQLENDIELTTARLGRAGQLMSGLSSEQSRWADSVESLTREKGGHVGRMALAAGFVAYLGPFTSPYREKMIRSWRDICDAHNIPIGGTDFNLSSIVDPVLVRTWAQKGLPPDPFSVENGVITTKSQRWCLCIDPQGQAVNWIRSMERGNNLRVIKLTDNNYMRVLENAIRVGLPVLIENVEESLDAALDAVLLRQTYRSQGRLLIKLGDNEVDYDPSFRLYITTKLANPHYLPELQIKVTIINFTVTQIGLENQLLADVVRFECAELEQRADQTILDIANGKTQLKELEDRILLLLGSSTGNILDNEQLVNTLNDAKKTSESVSEALRVAEETQKDISTARNRYRPVAIRGATIYTVISELAVLDHMYQVSLDFFKMLFRQTLQRTEKVDDVDQRVTLLLPAVTLSSYNTICRGLFEKDKLTFAFLLYSHIYRQRGEIQDGEWAFLLKGSEGHKYVSALTGLSKCTPDWLTDQIWNEVAALAHHVPDLKDLLADVHRHPDEWSAWFSKEKAYEEYPKFMESFSLWRKTLVLKAFREDLVNYGLSMLISDTLGKEFTESPPFDLEGCFLDSTPVAPIIFVLTPGSDPTTLFTEFADRKGFGMRKFMLSLGQDQGRKAEEMIRTASKEGMWVYLQNCHVYGSWMPVLDQLVEELHTIEVHRNFRLWLTTMPTLSFPVLLLQSGVKVVKEPPKGLKANIRDSFALEVTPDVWDSCPQNSNCWRRLLCSLTYFHAVIQERRKFGPLGWNIPYEWNQSDFSASLQSLSIYIPDDGEEIPWKALTYMIGVINYGGRVTDFLDSRSLMTILRLFFNPDVTIPNQNFNITADGVYCIPENVSSLDDMKEYLSQLPPFESPELFGLHANADIAFNRTAARRQLASVLSVQPRSKVAAGLGPEDKVLEIVREFEKRLPPLINKSESHPDTYRLTPEGAMISLGTVASQEIDVFNRILKKLESTLIQLRRAIKGEVVMSAELEAMFDSVLLGQVPQIWHDGGYLSRKPLASWFEDTLLRVEFFRTWNNQGIPTSFWISGFFFPQGFLTGVLQTHSRLHKIPIDNVKFKTNVTTHENIHTITSPLNSGVFIHGLFLEGARYEGGSSKCLMESKKGELYTKMPVIHLEPVLRSEITSTDQTYSCPMYKTSARAGALSTTGLSTNFVISLDLPAGEGINPDHWVRRGVALLCMLDD